MTGDEWIKHWEDAVKRAEEKLEQVPASYQELGYWRDVVPYKHILRSVRLRADVPICWGAADCVEYPLEECAAKKHESCAKHQDSCFMCKASDVPA
jgi:hypothetical protein